METRQARQRVNTKNVYERRSYIEGNAVRKIDTVRELQQPLKRENQTVRRNREKALYMNFPYVMFLAAAMAMTALMLIGYLLVVSQWHISALVSHVAYAIRL